MAEFFNNVAKGCVILLCVLFVWLVVLNLSFEILAPLFLLGLAWLLGALWNSSGNDTWNDEDQL